MIFAQQGMPRTPCGHRDAGEGGKGKMGSGALLPEGTSPQCSEENHCFHDLRDQPLFIQQHPGTRAAAQRAANICGLQGKRKEASARGGEKEAREELLCWEMEEGRVKSNIVFQESFEAFQTDLGWAPWLSTPMRQG